MIMGRSLPCGRVLLVELLLGGRFRPVCAAGSNTPVYIRARLYRIHGVMQPIGKRARRQRKTKLVKQPHAPKGTVQQVPDSGMSKVATYAQIARVKTPDRTAPTPVGASLNPRCHWPACRLPPRRDCTTREVNTKKNKKRTSSPENHRILQMSGIHLIADIISKTSNCPLLANNGHTDMDFWAGS
jgi:hypothetical protein